LLGSEFSLTKGKVRIYFAFNLVWAVGAWLLVSLTFDFKSTQKKEGGDEKSEEGESP